VAGKRLFYQKPLWQRMIIMFSGVGINLVLAFLIFLGINLGYGQWQPSLTISYVQQCVDPAAAACEPTPAAAMGLTAGDRVVAFNGTTYTRWPDLTAAIRANGDGPVQLDVVRDGQRLALPQVPGRIATVADPNNTKQTIQAGFLGVNPGYENVKVGPGGTLVQMWDMTTQSIGVIVRLPVVAVNVLVGMIEHQPRDPNGPISIVGASVIAGEVAANDTPGFPRLAVYLSLLGSLNLFVGLMNLVPLPPFDGGQVAAGIFEAIRRGLAKLRGRPDPGPADTAKLLPLTYLVGGLLVIIGVILIVADIISPVSVF